MKKSELRQMIREVLKEELATSKRPLKESNRFSGTILIDALDKALERGVNIAVDTKLGKGTLATIKQWAADNGLKTYIINSNSEEINNASEHGDTLGLDSNTVLVIDGYDRIAPKSRANVLSNITEGGQLFTIACYDSANRNSLNAAEMRRFEFLIRV